MSKRGKEALAYERLKEIVGSSRVSNDDFELWCSARDGSTEPPILPSLVVMPRTTEEVSQIVRLANELRIPVWPRGAGTGIDVCGMPLSPGGIVVDMTQMTALLEIDEEQLTATVQAGIVLRTFEQRLKEKGLHPRIQGSFGSGLGATVAGGIATGAAGLGCTQYGNYCTALVSMEVVLPNGDVVRTGSDANPASGRFARYVSGPDLAGLYCLSHGIFGIITEVTMEVMPAPEACAFMTPVFPTVESLVQAAKKIGMYELAYTATGYFGGPAVQKALPGSNLEGGLLLIEIKGRRKELEYKKEYIDQIVKDEGGRDIGPQVGDAIFKSDDPHMFMTQYWHNGKFCTACNCMPFRRIPDFVELANDFFLKENKEVFEKHNMRGPFVGMLGFRGHYVTCPNGFIYDEDRPEVWHAADSLAKKWNERIIDWGGAPYHIGMAFGSPLVRQWSDPYYKCMRSLKDALDPNGILNPGMFERLAYNCGKEREHVS